MSTSTANRYRHRLVEKTLLVSVAGTAAAYALLGWLGLKLAIPPGYASPLFPAAGFAVAACLLAPRAALVGVVAGSAMLNLFVGGTGAWPMALGIAAGAALQATLASWIVRRQLGDGWRRMETAHDVVVGLLLAGPMACVVSATVGNLVLYGLGVVTRGELAFSWWSWWLGDTLGVLLLLPVSLALLARSESAWRLRLWFQVIPVLLLMAVANVIYLRAAAAEKNAIDISIRDQGEVLAGVLKARFIAHAETLSALARLIEVTPDMDFAQFEHFTRITRQDNPDIFAMSFNPYVLRSERKAMEARLREVNGLAQFGFKERDAQGKLVPAAERTDYVVVGYIAPLAGNAAARGYDIGSNPLRRDAIDRAITSGRLALTASVSLVQADIKHVGALMLQPAYAPAKKATDKRRLLGFAVAVVKLDQMLTIALGNKLDTALRLRISDVTGDEVASILDTGPTLQTNSTFGWRHDVKVADRVWRMEIEPTRDYLNATRRWTAWAIGIIGLLITALLQMVILLITGSAAIARRRVSEQSGQLATQDAVLRERTAQIDALFERSPDGLVTIGPTGLVRLTNPAFHAMTGIVESEITGHPLAVLEAAICDRMEMEEDHRRLATLLTDQYLEQEWLKVTLSRPRHTVLQIANVKTANGAGRFIYLRDVTHEDEVDRMKSEFLASAAHELRTPMVSIFGFTELLIKREYSPERRLDMLQTIHRQSGLLVKMINELLDLARIESRGGLDMKIDEHPLTVLVDDSIRGLMRAESERQVLRGPIPDTVVMVDPEKMQLALNNLLSNAFKYSPDGGDVSISATMDELNGRSYAVIQVRDHGMGMKPEQLERAFERFYRADTTGNIPGTGLGLSLVKEIAELHGGCIELESKYGQGTTAKLWIPRSTVSTPSKPRALPKLDPSRDRLTIFT